MSIRFLLAIAFCAVAFSAFAQAPAEQMDVVVPAHDIARGAVLAEGDLTMKGIAVMRANDGIVLNHASRPKYDIRLDGHVAAKLGVGR